MYSTWDLTKLYFMARLYVELLDITEPFSEVLLMIQYLLCHGLSDSVGKKNWIILFFLSRNMNRQKLKGMSYPINSIVTTSLGTWAISYFCLIAEQEKNISHAMKGPLEVSATSETAQAPLLSPHKWDLLQNSQGLVEASLICKINSSKNNV